MWPFSRKKQQTEKISKEDLQFADAVLYIARCIDEYFRASRGAPSDEQVARQEIAVFALVFCEIPVHFGLQNKARADSVMPKILGFAIGKLVDENYAASFDALSELYQTRHKVTLFDIQYEIFDRWKNNKTGGAHFAFARLFSKAYQVSMGETPLIEFAVTVSALLEQIFAKGGELKKSFQAEAIT